MYFNKNNRKDYQQNYIWPFCTRMVFLKYYPAISGTQLFLPLGLSYFTFQSAGYLIDVVLKLLGAPDKVTPFLRQTRGDGVVDNGLAVLEYPRATATVRVSIVEIEGYKYRRVIVCGTKGSFELSPIEYQAVETPLKVRLTLKEPCGGYAAGTHTVDCGPMGNRYQAQQIEFAKVVRGEIANPYPVEYEYLLQKTLLEASGFRFN